MESPTQGGIVISLRANVYSDPFDHLLSASGVQMVRCADDFVIRCRSEAEASAALTRVKAWGLDNGLHLHPEKPRLVDV